MTKYEELWYYVCANIFIFLRSDLQMSFSERLKELRLQSGLSQSRLAIELDIATRTYIYYEKGEKFPSIDLLSRITKFFKVSISFTIDEHGDYIAQTQENHHKKVGAKQLAGEISSMFIGDELSETEKDELMETLQEAYLSAKKKNNQP